MRFEARRRTPWLALVALILFAFALRVHRLGESSLSGDEAFAIRYWAQPPAQMLTSNGLAWSEPHPFGTFFGFWAWKSLVGDGEFAMRMLPVLANLIGVPAMYAFTRRLLRDKTASVVAAFLWAINPNLIWHSQDVRNYALWVTLSVLSFWLLLRATDRSRRIAWLLYVISTVLTLYVFFLEAFVVAVHALYVMIFRRKRLVSWLIAMIVIGLLLTPWFGQLWALAHSGYHGTATRADFSTLVAQFVPALLFGENLNSNDLLYLNAFVTAAFIIHLYILIAFHRHRTQTLAPLLIAIPTALLFLAATRLDVFRPRYLIAVTPGLLLLIANTTAILLRGFRQYWPSPSRFVVIGLVFLLGPFAILSVDSLSRYYNGNYHKAADWRGLGSYLHENTTAADTVIVSSADPNTGTIDPAFGYYYPGPAKVFVLPYPGVDTVQFATKLLESSRSVWLIPGGNQSGIVDEALLFDGMLIGTQSAGGFDVRQYRTRAIKAGEIAAPLNLSMGVGLLMGYSLAGSRRSGGQLIVLLYWKTPPSANLKAFVHLIGPPKPDGSPLWAQDDHPPQGPGRDVYRIDLSAVTPGTYQIEIGMYDPASGQRVQITDSGKIVGESSTLTSVDILAH